MAFDVELGAAIATGALLGRLVAGGIIHAAWHKGEKRYGHVVGPEWKTCAHVFSARWPDYINDIRFAYEQKACIKRRSLAPAHPASGPRAGGDSH